MHARLKYWAGDHLGYLDALAPLLRKCKVRARAAAAAAVLGESGSAAAMWRERGTRVSLTIASQLVEMKVRATRESQHRTCSTRFSTQDFGAAARFLEPLCQQSAGRASPALRSAIARIYLQGGHLGAASQHFAAVDADPHTDDMTREMNRAIEGAAYGHWDKAVLALKRVLEIEPDNAVVRLPLIIL